MLALPGAGVEKFLAATAAAAAAVPPTTMLHAGIHSAYEAGVGRARGYAQRGAHSQARLRRLTRDRAQAACTIFTADASLLAEHPELGEEVFGPASVIFRCRDFEEMYAAARRLEGNLGAAIHGTEQDLVDHAELVRILQRKVGRIVFNGFATGIEVCSRCAHGGPYPATTHSHFTSIGHAAIYRFTRPVCFRIPAAALPAELQDGNPRGLSRLVDGRLSE